MPVIPIFLFGAAGGAGVGTPQGRSSAFNFCDPFDHVLPPADSSVSALDRQHLWGMYSGIPASAGTAAERLSAFNFCDPFDHVLPIADSTVSATDRAHLWGMYAGISPGSPVTPTGNNDAKRRLIMRMVGGYSYP